MKKSVLVVTLCLILVISMSSCKKKEEPPIKVPFQPVPQGPIQPAPQGPIQPAPQMPMQPAPQTPMPGAMSMGKTKVVVPDTVKGKWSAVKLIVEDRTAKKTQEYTVNLNSDFKIPDSNIKIYVGDFLPDFKREGIILTSSSNEPNNPAVGVRILEGNKQIFPTHEKKWGWLFSKFPLIHPLQHPRYNIHLKEGIPRTG